MNDGDLSDGISKLYQALKSLHLHWARAKEHWHDETARAFEENHLQPLEQKTTQAIEAMTRLTHVLTEAHAQCSRARPDDGRGAEGAAMWSQPGLRVGGGVGH